MAWWGIGGVDTRTRATAHSNPNRPPSHIGSAEGAGSHRLTTVTSTAVPSTSSGITPSRI